MALLVEMFIISPRFSPLGPRRNNHLGFSFQDQPDEIISIIGHIGNQVFKLEALDQCFGLSDLVPLSSGQDQAQRIAQPIDTQMNFGAEPASTVAQGLFSLSPVFFCAPAAQG